MMKTLTEIMEKEDHQSVLAVSHGGACFNFLRGVQDPNEELKRVLRTVVFLCMNTTIITLH